MANRTRRKRQQSEQRRLRSRERAAQWVAPEQALAADKQAPIHECLVSAELFERGIGYVVFSRRVTPGRIWMAMFLIDVFCLGVKDALHRTVGPNRYEADVGAFADRDPMVPVEPEYARKLVEGAVTYAGAFGLEPHADYAAAREVFGDVDAAQCTEFIHYGREGRPFYANGPFESPQRVKQVLAKLEERCGPGNFDFAIVEEV